MTARDSVHLTVKKSYQERARRPDYVLVSRPSTNTWFVRRQKRPESHPLKEADRVAVIMALETGENALAKPEEHCGARPPACADSNPVLYHDVSAVFARLAAHPRRVPKDRTAWSARRSGVRKVGVGRTRLGCSVDPQMQSRTYERMPDHPKAGCDLCEGPAPTNRTVATSHSLIQR
jgi:hypothetical protein